MCNIAILDNVLMLDKNLELSEKLKKEHFNIVYIGSELNEILAIENQKIDIFIIGNLGSKDYMNMIYEYVSNQNLASKIIFILAKCDINCVLSYINSNVYAMLTYKEYNDLEKIIDAVKIGSKYISSELHAPIMQYFIKKQYSHSEILLSGHAHEVLQYLSKGCQYAEIAEKMGFSLDSVRYYIKEIYKTLGVNNKGAAVGMFLRKEIKINTILRDRKKFIKPNSQHHFAENY